MNRRIKVAALAFAIGFAIFGAPMTYKWLEYSGWLETAGHWMFALIFIAVCLMAADMIIPRIEGADYE